MEPKRLQRLATDRRDQALETARTSRKPLPLVATSFGPTLRVHDLTHGLGNARREPLPASGGAPVMHGAVAASEPDVTDVGLAKAGVRRGRSDPRAALA